MSVCLSVIYFDRFMCSIYTKKCVKRQIYTTEICPEYIQFLRWSSSIILLRSLVLLNTYHQLFMTTDSELGQGQSEFFIVGLDPGLCNYDTESLILPAVKGFTLRYCSFKLQVKTLEMLI